MGKRAIGITNSEISMVFFIIGLILIFITLKGIFGLYSQVSHPITGNPGLASQFSMYLFLISISIVFFLMAVVLPNYLISKYNLNIFVDRISNPDFIGWLRFTKSKSFRAHIVRKGPLGQTKGVANGVKSDCINNGDFTVTLPNGNQAIIKSDLLSHNVNLHNNVGWQLIKKHHGVIGFNAWEKCVEDGETLFKFKDEETKQSKEEDDDSIDESIFDEDIE